VFWGPNSDPQKDLVWEAGFPGCHLAIAESLRLEFIQILSSVMSKVRKSPKPHVHYHKDGSIWAKGQLKGDTMVGCWEWFRKDGTRMRSGHFEDGEQIGEWTTYDTKGEVYKVTKMKPKAARKKSTG
jgi:hypothetical protein